VSNFSSPELAGPTTSGALLFFLGSTFLMALLHTGFFFFSLLEPKFGRGQRIVFHICAVVELAIHP
jgi:hypothetical protein